MKGILRLETENTREIYSSMDKVWPDNSIWYNHVHRTIINFVEKSLSQTLTNDSIYLNAGSGGSTYNLPGTCYHVDIAENLIKDKKYHYVASIEQLPFKQHLFDSIICVGSVLNYCSALESLSEMSRVLKPGGFLILEFERSHSAELWFSNNYGKKATLQKYEYLNNIHALWLYSEKYIRQLLKQYGFRVITKKRFHSLSAVANLILKDENKAGKLFFCDKIISPLSYFMAHNIILLCEKNDL